MDKDKDVSEKEKLITRDDFIDSIKSQAEICFGQLLSKENLRLGSSLNATFRDVAKATGKGLAIMLYENEVFSEIAANEGLEGADAFKIELESIRAYANALVVGFLEEVKIIDNTGISSAKHIH